MCEVALVPMLVTGSMLAFLMAGACMFRWARGARRRGSG